GMERSGDRLPAVRRHVRAAWLRPQENARFRRGSDRLRLPYARTRRCRGAKHRLAGPDCIQAKLYRLRPGKTRTNVRREEDRNLPRTCAVYRPETDAAGDKGSGGPSLPNRGGRGARKGRLSGRGGLGARGG